MGGDARIPATFAELIEQGVLEVSDGYRAKNTPVMTPYDE